MINLLIVASIFFALYTILCAHLVYFAYVQNEITSKSLEKKPPDLVVVFTGDAGRISEGLTIAKKSQNTRIFITGVYTTASIKDILEPIPDHNYGDEVSGRIEIDYQAKNTVENVLSTFYFLRKEKSFKRILIISSDYHLSRISLILHKLAAPSDGHEFFLQGMKTDYTQMRSLKILYREGIKWIKTLAFLLLWDNEGQISHSLVDMSELPGT